MKIIVNGASGRVGQRLLYSCLTEESVELAGATVSSSSNYLGQDCGKLVSQPDCGVCLSDQLAHDFDALIDFSTPTAALAAVQHCVEHQRPIVVATTGFEPSQVEAIESASATIPICVAPNTSLAVNIAMNVSEQIARTLAAVDAKPDVEIIERHHRYKVDSPSGTALKFGQLVAEPLGLTQPMHGRDGVIGQRQRNEIGYHAVRVGDDVGQHTVIYGMLGELLEVRVAATNRDAYATGAIAAARFLTQQSSGMFTMNDVLGLS